MPGKKKKIGEALVEKGFINPGQLQNALLQQGHSPKRLGEILVELGFLSEIHLASILGQLTGLPAVDLMKIRLSKEVAKFIPLEFCQQHQLVPLGLKHIEDKGHLVIAFSDPMNLEVLDELRSIIDLPIFRVIATRAGVLQAIERQYRNKVVPDVTGWEEVSLNTLVIPKTSPEFSLFEKRVETTFKLLIQTLVHKGMLTQQEANVLTRIMEK